MSISLKFKLTSDKTVLVTNNKTNEQKKVPLSFLQEATGDSLLMLMQYKQYELLINAEKAWSRIKCFNAERKETKPIYVKPNFRENIRIENLSLKLELTSDNKVLVTNSKTKEQKKVPMFFLQKVTGDSLLMLVQHKQYELLINAERAWDRIKCFNAKREEIEQIYIEQEFRRIMVNDDWAKITDYDRKKYIEALAWINTYYKHSMKT